MENRKKTRERKKRAWVKPAAAAFLVVMVLLTFFSNTIMNFSLAEVSVRQAASGTITAKVRGTGTVVSGEAYDVVLSETRKVEEVRVSAGDTVAAGDILFVLEEAESAELKEARDMLKSLRDTYEKAVIDTSGLNVTAEQTAVTRAEEDLAAAQRARSAYGASTMSVASATEAKRLADVEATERAAEKNSLENKLAAIDESSSSWSSLQSQLAQATSRLEKAEEAARAAANTLEKETNIAAADDTVKTARQALEDAKLALSQRIEENEKTAAVSDIDLSAQKEAIAKQEAAVAELESNTVVKDLTAKYGGIVTTVNVTAGTSVTAGEVMAQLSVSEKGYTADITLTREQAVDVKVGDTAEVRSGTYWGAEITATVERIKDGAAGGDGSENAGSAGTNKIVVFRLEGDVTIGETLQFTLSQKSTNYDVLVASSAVRTDSNGSFVLIITEKNTPLGTRYIATRVDVTVIESDETNTAVSGGISPYDSVITTASKIVEPGDYVRLAETG